MKVEMEITITNRGCQDLNGTSLKGYLPKGTTYKQIKEQLGKPDEKDCWDGKTKACWNGKINGLRFSIYDYKEYDTPVTKITDWHVGGDNEMVAALISVLFSK